MGTMISMTNLSHQQTHLVFVDDNKAFLELIQLVFVKHLSITITTVIEATQVLDILKNNHIDLIITDYKMPVLDGLTLAKQLREHGYCGPIILLSSYIDVLIEEQAFRAGINLCMQKHIDIYQIYVWILQYLQEHNFIVRS